jgi:hypothetical protein
MARTTTPPRFYAMSQLAFLDRDVSQFGWSAVSPSRPALSQSAARTGRQAKRTAARSHAQPPLCVEHGEHGEHWTLMAGARGAKLDQAGCVRTSASASRPLYGAREAEAGGPSKSVTATPSISVILLINSNTTRHFILNSRLQRPDGPIAPPTFWTVSSILRQADRPLSVREIAAQVAAECPPGHEHDHCRRCGSGERPGCTSARMRG